MTIAMLCIALAFVTIAAAAEFPDVGDWHYPAEEQEEWATLQSNGIPVPVSIDTVNSKATLSLNGTSSTVAIGGMFQGWKLQSVFSYTNKSQSVPLVVLEYLFEQWGVMVMRGSSDDFDVFRRGAGSIQDMKQPRYNLTDIDPDYYTKASGAQDYISQLVLNETQEPTFADVNKYLPPRREYALIGAIESLLKYTVCNDGRIKRSNNSIYEDETKLGDTTAGEVVFEPRLFGAHWPQQFTDLKMGLVGRTARVVVVAAWDSVAGKGFEMVTFASGAPNATVYVRLDTLNGSLPALYSIEGPDAHAVTVIGTAAYYTAMYDYLLYARHVLDSPTRMDVTLPFGDQRVIDMAQGAILASISVFQNLRPNYGTGYDYWSVTDDRGAGLPLTTFAINNALREWGLFDLAAERISYYFDTFVRDDGSINIASWKDCPFPFDDDNSFPDGIADYGRFLDMWVRLAEVTDNTTWVSATLPRALDVAGFTAMLVVNSTNATKPADWRYGLVYGPAEHDTCSDQGYYISTQVWMVRGLKEFGTYLKNQGKSGDYYLELASVVNASLINALPNVTVMQDGQPTFVAPKLGEPVVPFSSMTANTLASYCNFRYWTETLLASVLPAEYELALLTYREDHGGLVSGITRWSNHLDDMPSVGYGWSHLVHDRTAQFYMLHWGHMANYMSPGVFASTEQLGITGSSLYRDYLSGDGAHQERDIDYCGVSAVLPSFFLKWQLVMTPFDITELWLARAAPRRWFASDEGFGVSQASTRYGTIDYTVNKTDESTLKLDLSMTLGMLQTCPTVVLRAKCPLATAAVQGVNVTGDFTLQDFDSTTGDVSLYVPTCNDVIKSTAIIFCM